MCMYVSMYVCMCVCMNVSMYGWMYVCMGVSLCICVWEKENMYV